MKGIGASAGRSRANSPNPAATPPTAATLDSTAAITEICRGVAPTRRIAAKRCSRRAADSRVAVPMKIRTGNSSAAVTTDRTRSMPFALMPTSRHCPLQPLGGVVAMAVTWVACGVRASWSARRPTTRINESGAGSAAGPRVPICRPG
nr:hypothetical protein [Frankia sp. ArI3]